mgnify:FL=1
MDFGGRPDNLQRAMRGAPSLRRELAGVDNSRLQQFMATQAPTSRIAPNRDKSLLRRRLRDFAATEAMAAPNRERADLEQLRQQAIQQGDSRLRALADQRLQANPARWGSVAAQNNPDRWGSAASIRFRGLYGE